MRVGVGLCEWVRPAAGACAALSAVECGAGESSGRYLLDVLEEEGSMGFTEADPGLFKTWAGYYDARKHMIDFMNHVREPLSGRAAGGALGSGAAAVRAGAGLAAFARAGKGRRRERRVSARLSVRFRVPADGTERFSAGSPGLG